MTERDRFFAAMIAEIEKSVEPGNAALWKDVTDMYAQAITEGDAEGFEDAFMEFLEMTEEDAAPDLEAVEQLLTMAAGRRNRELAQQLLANSTMGYTELPDGSEHPVWAAYMCALTDVEGLEMPENPLFLDTLEEIRRMLG